MSHGDRDQAKGFTPAKPRPRTPTVLRDVAMNNIGQYLGPDIDHDRTVYVGKGEDTLSYARFFTKDGASYEIRVRRVAP